MSADDIKLRGPLNRVALAGPQSARCLEETTVTSLLGIFSSFRFRKPVFPPPCSAAGGNCSGYLAVKPGLMAEWCHKNKQMHPKHHSTTTTTSSGSGSSWQRDVRKVAAPRPRRISWVGVSTTSDEDEIKTHEESKLADTTHTSWLLQSMTTAANWLQSFLP